MLRVAEHEAVVVDDARGRLAPLRPAVRADVLEHALPHLAAHGRAGLRGLLLLAARGEILHGGGHGGGIIARLGERLTLLLQAAPETSTIPHAFYLGRVLVSFKGCAARWRERMF